LRCALTIIGGLPPPGLRRPAAGTGPVTVTPSTATQSPTTCGGRVVRRVTILLGSAYSRGLRAGGVRHRTAPNPAGD